MEINLGWNNPKQNSNPSFVPDLPTITSITTTNTTTKPRKSLSIRSRHCVPSAPSSSLRSFTISSKSFFFPQLGTLSSRPAPGAEPICPLAPPCDNFQIISHFPPSPTFTPTSSSILILNSLFKGYSRSVSHCFQSPLLSFIYTYFRIETSFK